MELAGNNEKKRNGTAPSRAGWQQGACAAGASSDVTFCFCGSPPGVIVADTLSFNAKMDLVDFLV